jgi:hypothetical protein
MSQTAPLPDSYAATRDTAGPGANFIVQRSLSGIFREIVLFT